MPVLPAPDPAVVVTLKKIPDHRYPPFWRLAVNATRRRWIRPHACPRAPHALVVTTDRLNLTRKRFAHRCSFSRLANRVARAATGQTRKFDDGKKKSVVASMRGARQRPVCFHAMQARVLLRLEPQQNTAATGAGRPMRHSGDLARGHHHE
jgi:hypothetical protein